MHHAELVCSNGCGYECAVGNAAYSAFQRISPDNCPGCGADLEAP